MPPPERSVRFTVVRGTRTVNVPELAIFANLKEHGFAPEMIGAKGANFSEKEVGMPVRRLPTPKLAGPVSRTVWGGYMIGQVSAYRYMHEYLRGFSSAVAESDVLCPVDIGHPTSFQCVQERPRVKVVVQCWEDIPFNWPQDRPVGSHYQAVLDQADFFLPFSKCADRCLRLQGVGADRRAMVYNGLDLEAFRPPSPAERATARKALGVGTEDVVVSYVGEVGFRKGIYTLLEALADVDPRATLHVFGTGPQRRRVEWKSQRLGVGPRVRFHGWVPHDQIQPRAYWAADIGVLASVPQEQWRDQLPYTVQESMACGLPVVASCAGGAPELVRDGETGALVPPDWPEGFVGALNRLIADPQLRARWGAAARRRAEEMLDARKGAAAVARILRDRVLG